MKEIWLLLCAGSIWAGYAYIKRARRRAKRLHAMAKPFPEEWAQILRRNLPPYSKLTSELRHGLHQNIKLFLFEKSFEGCGGLEITDEIKITIAAQACMLLLNRKIRCYPKLNSVLVYPSTYVTDGKRIFSNNTGSHSVRLGESWGRGTIVLSWNNVKQGAFNFRDGHNVALHEFAHQLDQEDGSADGAPIMERRSAYSSWARVFTKEFDRLQRKVRKRKRSTFYAYGATNPAEFFAVATETFFEKPVQLQKKHRELYQELKDYYKVDPIEWV